MTTEQRNAVNRLILAAESVIDDYDGGDLGETRFAVDQMRAEIQIIRSDGANVQAKAKTVRDGTGT